MSTETRYRLQPVRECGEHVISLKKMLGPAARRMLMSTLEQLHDNVEQFVRQKVADNQCPELVKALAWRKIGDQGPTQEYQLTIRGEALPVELRHGRQPELNVRLRVGETVARVQHDYQSQVRQPQADTAQQQVQQALDRVVAQAVNPLLAITLQQTLKQQAEQRLANHMVQQNLQTVVTRQMVIQTVGMVSRLGTSAYR